MRQGFWALLALVLVLILPATTHAVPVTVLNHSFESPAHPLPFGCGTDCSFNLGPVDDWTTTTGGFGVFHPNSSYFNLPLPDGSQTAYSNGGTLTQVLTATLQNSTTYTLSVEVGKRLDIGFPGYYVALFAGSTLLGLESILDPSLGEFATSILTFTSSASDPHAGEALRIELFSAGEQTNFDNVRLDASSVSIPEPGTSFLVGLGLVGLLSYHRRSRH